MERTEYEVMAAVEDRHWWYGGMRAISAALLDRAFGNRRDLRILDAGCGTGGNVRFLARYGQVFGIDLVREAVAPGAQQLPGVLAQGSVLDLPYAANSFDLVTSFDVLYHRAVADERVALREAARVLRPGGYLLIRLPAYEFLRSKHDRAVHTARRYTAPRMIALLCETGFVPQQTSYVNALLFPIPLAQRLVERVVPAVEQHDSDLALPTAAVNELLRWPMAVEAAWLERGGSFPFGLSVICLAQRDQ